MILTKEELDSLAKDKASKALSDLEESVANALVEAKCKGKDSFVDFCPSEEVSEWMLEQIGKMYEKENYKVEYVRKPSWIIPGSYMRIIIDDEKYNEEERRLKELTESRIIIPDKKWWEFWK